MSVFQAYTAAWQRRTLFVPVLLGVRIISFAIVAPLVALAARIAVSLSGQSALTDQDIAHFIFSPLGFPVFLLMAGLFLVGTVFGVAVMTVALRTPADSSIATLRSGLATVALRVLPLLRFAVELVARILLIVLPFAAVGAVAAGLLLRAYDINYYLTAHPPEFLIAVGLGALLTLAALVLLVPRLLRWAVALHVVLFDGTGAGAAFATSREMMAGKRAALVRDLVIWVVLRLALAAGVAALFALLIATVPDLAGAKLKLRLGLTVLLVILWSLAGLVVAAISTGALAKILLDRYEGGAPHAPAPPATPRLSGGALLVSVVLVALAGLAGTALLAPRISTSDQEVVVIAHRGAAGARPENTLAAMRHAVEVGADWVEIDVQETADGEVVVMHDSDFMKLAGNPIKIWEATLPDLAGIDIGSWYDPAYADERVPTLAEALETVRDRSNLLIELKYYGHDVDLEAKTIAIVEQANMADQVATMSLKYPAVQKMKALRPDWDAGVLAATAIGDLSGLEADFIAVNAGLASPKLVRRTHDAGKKLFVWTINDPLQMSAMISLGVDGLITDEPELAREVINTRAGLGGGQRILLVVLERLGLTAPVSADAQQ